MTEALCGLIENIKKEEKESETNNMSSASCIQTKKALSVQQVVKEIQSLAMCSLDRAGINLLAFA